MSRRPFEPTPEQRKTVTGMASIGMREDEIAKVIGISGPTLRKYFRSELDTAHLKANLSVANALYKKALGTGNQSVTACIFWLKTRAGWKEQPVELDASGLTVQIVKRTYADDPAS